MMGRQGYHRGSSLTETVTLVLSIALALPLGCYLLGGDGGAALCALFATSANRLAGQEDSRTSLHSPFGPSAHQSVQRAVMVASRGSTQLPVLTEQAELYARYGLRPVKVSALGDEYYFSQVITSPLYPEIEPEVDWRHPDQISVNPAFRVCYHWSCDKQVMVKLPEDTWTELKKRFFTPMPENEQEELQAVRWAVGLLEAQVAVQKGWYEGRPADCLFDDRAGDSESTRVRGRMDCVDTASNTMTYLTLLQAKGLLRFFRVANRISRYEGQLYNHFTAVLERKRPKGEAADRWAIDPWLMSGTGYPADIQTVQDWKRKKEPLMRDNPDLWSCVFW